MDSKLKRGMFRDAGCMITADPIAHDIGVEVWVAKKKCAWLDTVPQELEHNVLPSIGRLLQYLHPKVCGKLHEKGEKEILRDYWRKQTRSRKRLSFLEFLYELNVNLRVDFIIA